MIFKTVKESSIQDISNRKVGLKIIVINCSQLCVKNCKLGIRGSHKHGRICWHHIWTAQRSFVSERIFDRETLIFNFSSKLQILTIYNSYTISKLGTLFFWFSTIMIFELGRELKMIKCWRKTIVRCVGGTMYV